MRHLVLGPQSSLLVIKEGGRDCYDMVSRSPRKQDHPLYTACPVCQRQSARTPRAAPESSVREDYIIDGRLLRPGHKLSSAVTGALRRRCVSLCFLDSRRRLFDLCFLDSSRSLFSLGRRIASSGAGGRTLALGTITRRPEGEVVPQQLHDQRAVTVRVFGQTVKLGDGVVESLLGQVACAVRGVQDLVVKHGEIEGETEADGMGGRELCLCNIGSSLTGWLAWHAFDQPWVQYLVSLVCCGCSTLALLARGEFGQVAVIVSLPAIPTSVHHRYSSAPAT